MTETSREQMLEELDLEIRGGISLDTPDRRNHKKIMLAIYRLIKNSGKGPEVDEEFITWAQSFLNPYPGHGGMNAPSKSGIRQVLGRAGVRIKEEK